MKKSLGIIRNKNVLLTNAKSAILKKKTRFQVHKEDESMLTSSHVNSQALLTSTSIHSSGQQATAQDIYDKAKNILSSVADIQKKISIQAKARLSSFKQKQNERHDANISKMAGQATNFLIQSEKYLKQLSVLAPKNDAHKKLIDNMSSSLALEIREASKNLRQQQKHYFDTIRSYEKNTKNTAIELSEEQREMMKGFDFEEEMEEQKNDLENRQIDQLVKSINKLSTIYKELNNLVIEQGSLVDRIDVNIQSTLTHTQQAVIHLEAADEAASSAFADKMMKVMIALIMILAVILGLKWSH